MIVEQKTYAQILIIDKEDFIFSNHYREYEAACPFLCFPGECAADFRASLKEPAGVVPNKDVILLLKPYWAMLSSEEKKAVLDHELGHISKGHLRETAEKMKNGTLGSNPVSEVKEKEADAYSSEMNGKQAMHDSLLKAVEVIIGGYRAKGYRVSMDQVLKGDPILRNRLAVLDDTNPA
jgi:hypothetical protein